MRVVDAGQGESRDMKGAAIFGDGQVWIRALAGAQADPPSDVNVALVQFAPGAKTAWHTHSGDQTLFVVSGVGKVGDRQGERVITPGSCAVIPANEEHWHGAADTGHPMAHLAITRSDSETMLVE